MSAVNLGSILEIGTGMNVANCRKVIGSKVSALLIATVLGTASAADWTLWGGPRRDFRVDQSEPLADMWPAAGPRVLWRRHLGEGYSAIAVRDHTLFTMYRSESRFWQIFKADQEVVIALDADTGMTKWQFAYDAPFKSDQGDGPHIMPQLVGSLVFTIGVTGKLHALNAQTGELVWKRDLYQDFGATRMGFGYSSHPLPYGDNLIVLAGGKGKAITAIDQRSGRVAWAGFSFVNAYSSPILIHAGGRDQVVALGAQEILGVDPRNGAALWSRRLPTDAGMAFCATPLWDAKNQILVFSGGADGYGASALHITADEQRMKVKFLWHDHRFGSAFGNLLLAGDMFYLSRGYTGPAVLTAVDIKTGQPGWSSREFAKTSFLAADGKLIILDEHGWLVLAKCNPDGSLKALAKARLLTPNAWTVPTLAGTTLFLRDRVTIMALDVGKGVR
jgi:outer membrane protein assembly factor BamB